jgi:hypothetical protein
MKRDVDTLLEMESKLLSCLKPKLVEPEGRPAFVALESHEHTAFIRDNIHAHLNTDLIGFVPPRGHLASDILVDMVEHAQAELVDDRWKPKPPNTVLAEMLCAFESVRNYRPPSVSFFDDVILVTAEEWKYRLGMPRKKKKEASKEGWFVTERSRKGRREARLKKQQHKKMKKFANGLNRKGK